MTSEWKIPSLKQDILTGRSTGKGFHQHESSNSHQQAVQRLIKIPKSTEDISERIKVI